MSFPRSRDSDHSYSYPKHLPLDYCNELDMGSPWKISRNFSWWRMQQCMQLCVFVEEHMLYLWSQAALVSILLLGPVLFIYQILKKIMDYINMTMWEKLKFSKNNILLNYLRGKWNLTIGQPKWILPILTMVKRLKLQHWKDQTLVPFIKWIDRLLWHLRADWLIDVDCVQTSIMKYGIHLYRIQ